MRALWSGSLSFGLMNIPVQLMSATRERALKFRLFDKTDHCAVSYQKVCRSDNKTVDVNNIVKGYEFKPDQYVFLAEEDFHKAEVKPRDNMDIISFSDEADVDPIYYEKPYYVLPNKKAVKAYVLLRDALGKSDKVGIVRYVMREREHIGTIKAHDHLLLLNQLRYNTEIRQPKEIKIPKTKYAQRELAVAITLLNQLTRPFRMDEFRDTYTQTLKRLIDRKARGKPIEPVERVPVPPKTLDVDDLLAVLQASIETERATRKQRARSHHRVNA